MSHLLTTFGIIAYAKLLAGCNNLDLPFAISHSLLEIVSGDLSSTEEAEKQKEEFTAHVLRGEMETSILE